MRVAALNTWGIPRHRPRADTVRRLRPDAAGPRPRPGSVLAQLAGYLASGRHDAIIVVNLSRISRDPAEVLAFAVHCGRCGGTLEAVEEGRVDEARIAVLYARHRVVPA